MVAFTGDPDVVFTMNIKIAPRNKDLTLMFDNMCFGASDEIDAIYDADISFAHTVNLVLSGTNEITGGNGKPGSRDWTNITDASGGKAGINMGTNTLHVSGAGSLTVMGGRGGNGTHDEDNHIDYFAKFEDAFGSWGDTSINQDNPDGGVGIAGGSLNFNDLSGRIMVTGGAGGNGILGTLIDSGREASITLNGGAARKS